MMNDDYIRRPATRRSFLQSFFRDDDYFYPIFIHGEFVVRRNAGELQGDCIGTGTGTPVTAMQSLSRPSYENGVRHSNPEFILHTRTLEE
jgi:hypothetical protein